VWTETREHSVGSGDRWLKHCRVRTRAPQPTVA